ncbi:translation initiation factor IF-2 subunit beta [Candidatus Woesearchaeota archaeon]|nr:translation initiation factor IF-2 subunit beta [Candidatus Woesearchaeota archaeon]
MNYEEMLKKGREQLPDSALHHERFEIPKVRGHLQGNKTVISNFNEIVDAFSREPEHFLKYLLKELATRGELQKTQLILNRKLTSTQINEKVESYAKEFVLCKECKKPDTKIIKKDGILFIQCAACGSRHPIRKIL